MPTKSLADESKNGIPGLNDNVEQPLKHHQPAGKISQSYTKQTQGLRKITKPWVFNRCVKYLSVQWYELTNPLLILALHVMWTWIVKISILSTECFTRTSVFNAFFWPSYHSRSYQLIGVWPVKHGSGRVQKEFWIIIKKPWKSAKPLTCRFLVHFTWHDCSKIENVTSSKRTIEGYFFNGFHSRAKNYRKFKRTANFLSRIKNLGWPLKIISRTTDSNLIKAF